MNFPIYLAGAAVLAVFARQNLLGYTVLFWGALAFLYVLLDMIPGKTGWSQALFSAAAAVLVWAVVDWYRFADPFAHRARCRCTDNSPSMTTHLSFSMSSAAGAR